MGNAMTVDCNLIAGVNTETVQALLQLLYLLTGFIVRNRFSRHK